jgi:excisionase family DNA binding protein
MSTKRQPLRKEEIERAFSAELDSHPGPILSPAQLAAMLGISLKTIYEWIARGRLDGTFRKRGKHIRFWRDRVVALYFNGAQWETNDPDKPRNNQDR